ncbi:hypothetical protein DO021_04690 [Desulfobacter hydrogenophilus]|uniref:J domain-containing protein n=2 Tax=Desulfobacter hydrogenophilus TaxID=2291 RepID=A0A328FH59_9BACT|nr:J domain-containing protein [Desulfobacter hydrogenophilus]RAM03160.1 hypothetical protein DO021_04690 [Desulfobacter hydrogenophilus]
MRLPQQVCLKGLTGIGPRSMVEFMDKQSGFDILGLVPSATRTDARTAFRQLAKTWHPDKFAKDPLKVKKAEEKMKQVNEAFHFLLPLLPDTIVEPGVGQNPSTSSQGCASIHCSGKRFQGFFSSLVAGLTKRCKGKKKAKVQGAGRFGQTHKSGAHCRADTVDRTRKTPFETVFQNAVNHNPAGTKPRGYQKNRPPGCCANYRKYFNSVTGRPGNMGHIKNRGVGPVEKISPIAPVSSVKEH